MDPVVAAINDQPVTAAEYRLVMERKVALVYSYFKEHHNIWTTISVIGARAPDLDGPLAKLREMTRTELVLIKVCQGLAKAKGCWSRKRALPVSSRTLSVRMPRRAKAVTEKQVIYGPGGSTGRLKLLLSRPVR